MTKDKIVAALTKLIDTLGIEHDTVWVVGEASLVMMGLKYSTDEIDIATDDNDVWIKAGDVYSHGVRSTGKHAFGKGHAALQCPMDGYNLSLHFYPPTDEEDLCIVENTCFLSASPTTLLLELGNYGSEYAETIVELQKYRAMLNDKWRGNQQSA